MDQNSLIILLRSRLVEALSENGWGDIEVSQKFQPTQQGVPLSKGVFIQPLFDSDHGWHGRKNTYNDATGQFDTSEPQMMETTFQISALVIQQPGDPYGPSNPTAADVVKYLSRALMSGKTIEQFNLQNVRILRVVKSFNNSFMDDRDRSEYHPHFDVVLVHLDSYTYATPKIDKIVDGIYSV